MSSRGKIKGTMVTKGSKSMPSALEIAMIDAHQLAAGNPGRYQFRPIYRYDMGKDWLKPMRNSKYRPHTGKRELDRARRNHARRA